MISNLIHEHSGDGPSFDTGTPVPVTIDYVDAQLTELWRDVAEAAQAKGGVSAVTMAQVLNLLVKSDSYETAHSYMADIDSITGSHPARVITMLSDTNEPEMPVQAWVSIHCQVPPAGGRQVCAEQIWVASGANTVRQVPAAVIPLILPELPVFLWWPQGSPFDETLFKNLGESLDRLIVDSATFENPEGALAKVSSRLKSDWPKLACTDMNWERLTLWRELTAQFFDGPTLRPYLDRVRRVTIQFAQSGAANRAQALLFAGWLASRLGWQPAGHVYEMLRADGEGPSAVRLSLTCSGDPVTIMLIPSGQAGEVPGEICAVKLEVPGENPDLQTKPEATFEVGTLDESDHENEHAFTSVNIVEATPARRHVHIERPTRARLLDVELEIFSRDKVYDEALEMAGIFIRGTSKTDEGPRKITTGEPVSAGATRVPGPKPKTNRSY